MRDQTEHEIGGMAGGENILTAPNSPPRTYHAPLAVSGATAGGSNGSGAAPHAAGVPGAGIQRPRHLQAPHELAL